MTPVFTEAINQRKGSLLSATVLLVFSGVAWYGLSQPPAEALQLPSDYLIAVDSRPGQQILGSSVRTDYDQLAPEFVPQARRAFCGVATSVMVVNALPRDGIRFDQHTVFTPGVDAVRAELAVSFRGLTLDQLAEILRAHDLKVNSVHATQSSVEEFRNVVRTTLAEPTVFLVVNYDRGMLAQQGAGHISPLGAYDAATDRVLVLDVAAHKYPFTWVAVDRLWAAMNTTDPASIRTRGYLLVSSVRPHGDAKP